MREIFKKEKWKIFKSLRFRILVILLIIGIVPAVIIENGILDSYEERAVNLRGNTIKTQCDILCKKLINDGYMNGNPYAAEAINAEFTLLSNLYSGRVLIINRDFKIIKDTYDLEEGKTILSQEVMRSFQGEATSNYDRENHYIEMTIPVQEVESQQIHGVMLISISTNEIVVSLSILEKKGLFLLTIVILLVLVFGYILTGILVKPFARVTRSIEDLTDGYLDKNISVRDYTETELITDAFNKMLTRVKSLDDSRQEFVANVSHELKTPLTSMKVLADSLVGQDNVPIELYQEFMQDITAEIDRENKIITDLLSLVKLDKKAADMHIEKINITDLLGLILKRLRPIAAKQRIDLILESFKPVLAEVDEVKLTLALSNLVENGIKYNKEGGWVRISINVDSKYFYVTIADSGMGIPKDSLDRIFERFYRVDKSHSKEIGGSGLGLAITKNAIVMHHGVVKVHSEKGEGTTFSVRIPLHYSP